MHARRMDWQHVITEFQGLEAGRSYSVLRSFVDADGDEHRAGESWRLLGSMFSKFDDLVTLCVTLRDGSQCEVPLIWRPEAQGQLVEKFSEYLAAA